MSGARRDVQAILGLSHNHSYDLASRGEFPVPVLRISSRLRVAIAHLIDVLGIPP